MRIPVLLLIAVALSPGLQAWNKTGHQAIALLAYEQLTPEVRREVARILSSHPHASTFLAESVAAAGAEGDAVRFANAARWPDDIEVPPFAATYDRRTWHYINLPYVPRQYARQITKNKAEAAGDIVKEIERNLSIVADADAPAGDRAIALCWVAHLIGDVHQPLHATALYTPELPAGDRGGNLLAVKGEGEEVVTNLHAVWDTALIRLDGIEAARRVVERLKSLHPIGMRIIRMTPVGAPGKWAEESYEMAVDKAYRKGRLAFTVRTDTRVQLPASAVPSLPKGYEKDIRTAADLRAALAGKRLAAVLNRALGIASAP